MKLFVKLAAGLLMLAILPVARGSDGKKKHASASPTPMNIPIPVQHDAAGVKLPYFNDHGKLEMYFNISKALRLDLGHLEMTNAYMQTYDEKGVPDANVFMSRSVLDLNTRIVTSDVPVIVRRSDFEITGQKMVFNTQSRVGEMTGHVRMVIYNRQEPARPTPSPIRSAKSQPSATPNK